MATASNDSTWPIVRFASVILALNVLETILPLGYRFFRALRLVTYSAQSYALFRVFCAVVGVSCTIILLQVLWIRPQRLPICGMLKPSRRTMQKGAAAFGVGCILAGAVLVVTSLIYHYGATLHPNAVGRFTANKSGAIAWFFIGIIRPLGEELYYRGFIFWFFEHRYSKRLAFLIVLVWFTVAHLYYIGGGFGYGIAIFLLGIVTTWQRYHYENLFPCLMTHLAFNCILGTLVLMQHL